MSKRKSIQRAGNSKVVRGNSVKIVVIALAVILIIGAVAGVLLKKPAEPSEKNFVAETSMYKDDLSMFEYWANAEGKNVSTKNPYS